MWSMLRLRAWCSNMIMFRGKLTCSPNTLNNQMHTYFFAHDWQERNTEHKYGANPPQDTFEYSQQQWMKLVTNVAAFNRNYVHYFQNVKNGDPSERKNINIMDYRAFRLFHDWDVWGDGTSYSELYATGEFDPTQESPLRKISTADQEKLFMTSKLGGHKAVIANQDTDSQDISKMFGMMMVMDDSLKMGSDPCTNRDIHNRTVDQMPWTNSSMVDWFGSGDMAPLYTGVDLNNIQPPLKRLIGQSEKSLALMRLMQYRYNHPTKVSGTVGYLMNIEKANGQVFHRNSDQDQEGAWSEPNRHWRMVTVTSLYENPNVQGHFNGSTNNLSKSEVYLRNITYGPTNKQGVFMDLSGAILDANDKEYLPVYPTSITVIIKQGQKCNKITYGHDVILSQFHDFAGVFLIENYSLQSGSAIQISLQQVLDSKMFGKQVVALSAIISKDQKVHKMPTKAQFLSEDKVTVQFRDRFKKTKRGDYNIEGKHKGNKDIACFDQSIQYDIFLSECGELPEADAQYTLNLDSEFVVDSSGFAQYTTNMDYVRAARNQPNAQPVTPKQRIQNLLDESPQFREQYKDFDNINNIVYFGKFDQIVQLTDEYLKRITYYENQNDYQDKCEPDPNGHRSQHCKLKIGYRAAKGGNEELFKLTFDDGTTQKKVRFENGAARISVKLNQPLTDQNNPRHPSMASLCVTGKLTATNSKGHTSETRNFAGIFFQNDVASLGREADQLKAVDWFNVVGPRLRVMGLLYPSMQNIIDLYNYDGLSMNAMKRAFDVENENHSRYMPATREYSSIWHRQVRKWLYNPLFQSIHRPAHLKNMLQLHQNQTFEQLKASLEDSLRTAFKIELTTIPIYLSAAYSLPRNSEAYKMIMGVAIDEMKHLFIVSNLCNAVGINPPYPAPNSNANNEYVPTYPLRPPAVLQFSQQQHPQLYDLMNINIQPATPDQLLRFIIIETPAEAYLIQPEVEGVESTQWTVNTGSFAYKIKANTCKILDALERDNLIPESWDEMCKHLDIPTEVYLELKLHNIPIEVFMRVRKAREVLNAISQEMHDNQNFNTIGMEYEKIMELFWKANDLNQDALFSGDKQKQFTYLYLENMTPITNLRTALNQMRLITEEGEGSSIFSLKGEINKKSHFIKFLEIYTGCTVEIKSKYEKKPSKQNNQPEKHIRLAEFEFTYDKQRFPNFPHYLPADNSMTWSDQVNQKVQEEVDSELEVNRFSDWMAKTKFPNTYAHYTFLNAYRKILEELGFLFTANPSDVKDYENARVRGMENAIAKMRQMTMSGNLVVRPNDTFNNPNRVYPSSAPRFNLNDQSALPDPKGSKGKK